jgi:diguanylate cyclase (GGDEF)-like protein
MTKLDRNGIQRLSARLVRLCTLRDLGITARLAIAFASVAILAAASNFLVESGASIVEHVISGGSPAPVEQLPVTHPRDADIQQQPPRITASQLVLALGAFDKTVREHVDMRSKGSAASYVDASLELRRLAVDYEEQRARITREPQPTLTRAIQEHQTTAEALMEAARSQGGLLASYATTFSRVRERLQSSLDGAWKILGRVVARQSLLKLSAELDDIQNRFATRNAAGNAGNGAHARTLAEQVFLDTLQKNEVALRRSQGAEWFSGMHKDVTLLIASRASLARIESRKVLLAEALSRQTAELVEALSRTADVAAREETTQPSPADTFAPVPAAVLQETSRTVTPSQTSSRTTVAWVSAVVLVVLAYICVITILSVVRPVRRLLEATTRISKGQIATHVAPGGIRELDRLSHAFNGMADQLAAAQAENLEVLQSLETRIDERTSQLQELAERDPLTGLPNRRQLFTSLNASIGRAAEQGRLVGAFFLDIDNFKTLNDSMGHAYGDRVLIAIAHRLELTARSFGFAARLGGDEFMIVHEGAVTIDDIVNSGTRIVEAFQDPIKVEGRELIVSVSVGASVYPDHEQDAEALLRAADAALFNAKALGRSRMTLFTPELLVRASAKFAIEQNLRRAIEKGEFELFYQPEISVQNLEVSLVEALIRWRMPDGSYRSPDEFLAVAEESGLIMDVNDWVLRTAIEQASQWYRGPWPQVRVAINVSPRQFLDYRFVERLQKLLDEFQLPARCIELELTESVLQTGPTTIKALSQLRAIGVAIALDDFGTGYSSMASLEQLPLTRIKLDRSLIARMDSSARSASIARATIRLCSDLGLEVTAEGVERLEQFAELLGYRGISMQGYLLARPVTPDALLAVLKQLPAHCQELVLLSQSPNAPRGISRSAESEAIFAGQAQRPGLSL